MVNRDQGYGGVAIFVKENLYFKKRDDLHIPGLEAVWIETILNNEHFLIGSFYRPPSALVRYWDLISESFSKADSTGLKMIVLGDFNSDFNVPNRNILELINRYQLNQLVTSNTRITETSNTCLDLIFTQSKEFIENVEVLPEILSDHCTPCLTIKSTVNVNSNYKKTIFGYDKLDTKKFQTLLAQVNWYEMTTRNTINESAEMFCKTVLEIACKCMPVKTVRVSTRDKPWMTDEIRHAMKVRYSLFKRAQRSVNNQGHWADYRRQRNVVTHMVRQRRQTHDDETDSKISDDNNSGSKEWHKLVKQFFHNKGVSSQIPPILFNDILYTSDNKKANLFNQFFSQQSTLENPDDTAPQLDQFDNALTNIMTTTEEVKSIIRSLDKTKSAGPDNIHNRLLIAGVDQISGPLSLFFNRCLAAGVFPDNWKIAYVTPIHKKGDASLLNNYRPISLISCVGKLFERCVHKHVYTFLVEHQLISPHQSGFTSGDSAVNQLLLIYDNLISAYDARTTTQSIFFDISKAFDRVWHKGLIQKLEAIGIRGTLLMWFTDYLTNRRQSVALRGELSSSLPIKAGVPQGSVLGPLLFLIYINDITVGLESTIKLFADDTSISKSEKNPDTRATTLNADLEKIASWAKKWKINFNATKTELLTIKRDTQALHPLIFEDTTLTESDSHKHLGLILQPDCKWKKHIDFIVQKTNSLISCLKSYKYRLSRNSLNKIYKTFIIPHFDYCDVIYDNCTEESSEKLEALHREAIRTIIGTVKGTSHQKLYKESGFPTLKERRKQHKIIMMHKIIHNNCPSYLSERKPKLVSEINPYHRRRPLERHIPRSNSQLHTNSFFPSTTRLYNDLPDDIKSNPSISAMKHYLQQQVSTVVPSYYSFGSRKEQIIHTRLRLKMSDLNHDLYMRHLKEDPTCSCNCGNETSEHYLLSCQNYANQRRSTINQLPLNMRNIEILLFGNGDLSADENIALFTTVHSFIKDSGRFNL